MPPASAPRMTVDGLAVSDLGIDYDSVFEWQRSMAAIVTALLKIAGELFNRCLAVIGLAQKAVELTGFGLPLRWGLITFNLVHHHLLSLAFSFFILSIPRSITSILRSHTWERSLL
jgi:hypothetical protein